MDSKNVVQIDIEHMKKGIDEKDIRIIEVLKENAKLSTSQIAKKTGIPITTIHHRLKQLQEKKVITKFTIQVNDEKIGKTVSAYILIKVGFSELRKSGKSQDYLGKVLKQHPVVEEISMVAGETDFMCKVRSNGIKELDEFVTTYLRNLEGVETTTTL